MDRTSKNGLDLIGIAGGKLNKCWGRAFLATLMYVTPLILLLFVPYAGWAVSILIFGWLTNGYISYMKKLLNNENPSFAIIFTTVKEFAQATLIGVIMCVGTILGSLIFIVPGIMIIGYYSMSLFVLDEEAITGVSDSLNLASKKMEGNKTAMFAYKVIYYLLYVIVGLAFAIAFLFIAKLYSTQQALAICLGILDVIVAIILISIITVYFYASNVVFYNEIVREKQVSYEVKRPVEGTDVKELNIVETEPAVTEEVKVEEPKTEVAPEATEVKKPAAKKPAAKKATTTQTKPAAKTAEAKPATTTKKAATTKTTNTSTAKTSAAKKPATKKTTNK